MQFASQPAAQHAAEHAMYPASQKIGALAGRASGRRLPATPCRGASGSRMELQTLLRRTRESSGEMQVYIQEQYRFLREEAAPASAPTGGGTSGAMPARGPQLGAGQFLGVGPSVRPGFADEIPRQISGPTSRPS